MQSDLVVKNSSLASHSVGKSLVPRRSHPDGFTLVEMMVSVTLALLMILAVVQIFEWMGESVAFGRATIEMSSEMTTVTTQLQRDLDNITCAVKPWIQPGEGAGYFYYQEGPINDASSLTGVDVPANTGNPDINRPEYFLNDFTDPDPTLWTDSKFGDVDDVLAFTVRSTGKPFTGRAALTVGATPVYVESSLAEVIYVVHRDLPTGSWNLYRKVRLVLPAAITQQAALDTNGNAVVLNHDVATDLGGRPLSMTELTLPVNRGFFGRDTNGDYLFPKTPAQLGPGLHIDQITTPDNIVLQDVLAFDVRAFDPTAQILSYTGDNVPLIPGDPGFAQAAEDHATSSTNPFQAGLGAFVDLAYVVTTRQRHVNLNGGANNDIPNNMSMFSEPPLAGGVPYYSTMAWETVMDGLGADGLDNDDKNGVDDRGERNLTRNPANPSSYIEDPGFVQPPYEVDLRGIEVSLRMWEVQTGQVKQSSVVGDFVTK